MRRVFIAQCTSEVYWEQCWLTAETASGRKDLRYLLFTQFGCISNVSRLSVPVEIQHLFHLWPSWLTLKGNSTILHSWSVPDLRSLELTPPGHVTLFAFIFIRLWRGADWSRGAECRVEEVVECQGGSAGSVCKRNAVKR